MSTSISPHIFLRTKMEKAYELTPHSLPGHETGLLSCERAGSGALGLGRLRDTHPEVGADRCLQRIHSCNPRPPLCISIRIRQEKRKFDGLLEMATSLCQARMQRNHVISNRSARIMPCTTTVGLAPPKYRQACRPLQPTAVERLSLRKADGRIRCQPHPRT